MQELTIVQMIKRVYAWACLAIFAVQSGFNNLVQALSEKLLPDLETRYPRVQHRTDHLLNLCSARRHGGTVDIERDGGGTVDLLSDGFVEPGG